MNYAKERQVAIDAAIQAARLCQKVREEIAVNAIEKQDKSPVTIADFGAQALICHGLLTAFPNDAVVGEEDADLFQDPAFKPQLEQATRYVQGELPQATEADVIAWINHGNGSVAERYWTLDPIDGTKGFLRGDQYAVAIALIEQGEVKVGVLACPALSLDDGKTTGVLLVAVRGEGTQLIPLAGDDAPQALAVTKPGDSENFRFVESVEHGDKTLQTKIAQTVGITQPPVQMDSQAKYAAVAAGRAALYLRLPSPKTPDYKEKIWDHAAGLLVVEEAGGTVTDMHGAPLDFTQGAKLVKNEGVIVSSGTIHNDVLSVVKGS